MGLATGDPSESATRCQTLRRSDRVSVAAQLTAAIASRSLPADVNDSARCFAL
jgi:hypothetical protein